MTYKSKKDKANQEKKQKTRRLTNMVKNLINTDKRLSKYTPQMVSYLHVLDSNEDQVIENQINIILKAIKISIQQGNTTNEQIHSSIIQNFSETGFGKKLADLQVSDIFTEPKEKKRKQPQNQPPSKRSKKQHESAKHEKIATLIDTVPVLESPPLHKRDSKDFLKEFNKRMSKMLNAKVYLQGNDTESTRIKTIDILKKNHPELIDLDLNKLIQQDLEQRVVGFCSEEVKVITTQLHQSMTNLLNDFNREIIDRLFHGSFNFSKLTKLTNNKAMNKSIIKNISHLKIYPLVRLTNTPGTNYISQPASNLLESIFSCHILGYDHDGKIDTATKELNQIIKIIEKIHHRTTEHNAILLILKIHLAIFEKWLIKTKDNPTNAITQRITESSFNESYNINISFIENVQLFLKSNTINTLLFEIGQLPTEVFNEHCKEFNDNEKQKTMQLALDFYVNPQKHYSGEKLKKVCDEYLEQDNPFKHLITDTNDEYLSSDSQPSISNSSNAESSSSTPKDTSLEEVIIEVAERAAYKNKIPEFPALIPKFSSNEAVIEEQIFVFLELHSKKLLSTLSLQQLAEELKAVFLNEKSLIDASLVKDVEVTTQYADGQQQVTQALGFSERTIGAENSALPVANLPMIYTKMIDSDKKTIELAAGAGFLIVFEDDEDKKLGVVAKRRASQNDCTLQVTWGGKADSTKSLRQAVIDTKTAVLEGNKKFGVPGYTEEKDKLQINKLTDEITKILEKGKPCSATVNIVYNHNKSEDSYCYATIEIILKVKNFEQLKNDYSFLFNNFHHYKDPHWYFLDYNDFQNMMTAEYQQEAAEEWSRATPQFKQPPLLSLKGVYPLVKKKLYHEKSLESNIIELDKTSSSSSSSSSSHCHHMSTTNKMNHDEDSQLIDNHVMNAPDKLDLKASPPLSLFFSCSTPTQLTPSDCKRSPENLRDSMKKP